MSKILVRRPRKACSFQGCVKDWIKEAGILSFFQPAGMLCDFWPFASDQGRSLTTYSPRFQEMKGNVYLLEELTADASFTYGL